MPGEPASADVGAAASYPEDPAKITNAGGYTKQHVFKVGKIALYWKTMPSQIFIAGEEKSMPGSKASKDSLTFMLGANAVVPFIKASVHLPFQKCDGPSESC